MRGSTQTQRPMNRPEMWKKNKTNPACAQMKQMRTQLLIGLYELAFFPSLSFLYVAGDASGLSQFIRRAAGANRNFCPINNSNLPRSAGGTKQSRRRTAGEKSLDRWTSGRMRETGQSANRTPARWRRRQQRVLGGARHRYFKLFFLLLRQRKTRRGRVNKPSVSLLCLLAGALGVCAR